MGMNIVIIGAGRLATQLAKALHSKGHVIAAVYSRTLASAQALTATVGGTPTSCIATLPLEADAFFIAVKDDVIHSVMAQLSPGREHQAFFHTAGSVPLSALSAVSRHGVFYPMQTFSKERDVDFDHIPIFIEGSTDEVVGLARAIASTLTDCVVPMASPERRHLHLAAVFACNFANHCYALSAQILERHGLDFGYMLPLIDETARKVHDMHPREAQTGPAVRYDTKVMQAHCNLMDDMPLPRQVYELLSRSIHEYQTGKNKNDNSHDKL